MTGAATAVVAAGAEDALAAAVTAALRGRGVPVLTLDTARPASEIELALELTASGVSDVTGWLGVAGGDRAPLEAITGVLWRAREPFALDGDLHPDDQAFARSEANAAWEGLLAALRCPVLNRPTALTGPFWCSPAPTEALRDAGLEAPNVDVSRDLSAGEDLPDRRWLAGAARASARARVVRGGALGEALASLRGDLAYLVEIPRGRLLELFVAGGTSLATADEGDGVLRLVPAPPAAAAASSAILRRLGLDLGAVLVVETSPGAFTGLNVDPSPHLDGLDPAARRAVASAVAAALCPEVAA